MIQKLHEIQISEFINEVLLEYGHTHLLMYCLCLHSSYIERVELVATESMWHEKPKIYTTWIFTVKFADSWFRQRISAFKHLHCQAPKLEKGKVITKKYSFSKGSEACYSESCRLRIPSRLYGPLMCFLISLSSSIKQGCERPTTSHRYVHIK